MVKPAFGTAAQEIAGSALSEKEGGREHAAGRTDMRRPG